MALTDTKIRGLKPTDRDFKVSDEKGLFLLVKKTGGKYWRMKYRYLGKEKTLAIGVYPTTTLAQARAARDEARSLIANDVDPMAQRKAAKLAKQEASANSFKAIALEWRHKRKPGAPTSEKRLAAILERDLFPTLGTMPVNTVKPTDVLRALRKIENRGALETAKKARQATGQIFRYAIATGRADTNPAADLKDALKTATTQHYAALTDPKDVGRLMAAIHSYQATPAVMAAIQLAPLFFCRPGELRQMEWREVNLDEARIEIPAGKMKMSQDHIIPLSTQALDILRELEPVTGKSPYLFPNARSLSRPMSDNGLRIALRTMGYTKEQMTPHGFRAMARTLLDEVLGFPVDWIEHQLAHAVKDANGRAYNRTRHLDNRRKMMQAWADYLDTLRLEIDNVVPISAAKGK